MLLTTVNRDLSLGPIYSRIYDTVLYDIGLD